MPGSIQTPSLLRSMLQLRPVPRARLAFSLRPRVAMGAPVLAGWLAGDVQAGLMAATGGFTSPGPPVSGTRTGAGGGGFAWLLQMAPVLWDPRGPERRTVVGAAAAVARFLDEGEGPRAGRLRQQAAQALHEAWHAQVRYQPARSAPHSELALLRERTRRLGGLFADAMAVRARGGAVPDGVAAQARALGVPTSPLPEPEGEGRRGGLALGQPGLGPMLRESLRMPSMSMLVVGRVGVAALLAGALGAALELERAYWAIAAAVLMLHQGLGWRPTLQRSLERTLGRWRGTGGRGALGGRRSAAAAGGRRARVPRGGGRAAAPCTRGRVRVKPRLATAAVAGKIAGPAQVESSMTGTRTTLRPTGPVRGLATCLLVALLAACASAPERNPVAHWEGSPNHGDRWARAIVLHHTAMDSAAGAIHVLQTANAGGPVSAHYLVSDDGAIHQLVVDSQAAWHAGSSRWAGVDELNAWSIGIELDNDGTEPFAPAQVEALLVLLEDLTTRLRIPPHMIVGHSDIAPTRKDDPSVQFPWQELARHGFGLWPREPLQPPPAGFDPWVALRLVGYDLRDPEAALAAFHRRFRGNEAREWLPGDAEVLFDLQQQLLALPPQAPQPDAAARR